MAEFLIPIKNYIKEKYFNLIDSINSIILLRKILNNTPINIRNELGENIDICEFGIEFNSNFNQNVYFLITPTQDLIEELMIEEPIFIHIGYITRSIYIN